MHTVVGLFETQSAARDAIRRLQDAGISPDHLGVAMKDTAAAGTLADDAGVGDLSEEGATAGAVSGAGIGALVGLALVGSSFLLPGIGTFLIGGPLAAALTGAGIGAASGGLVGGLVGAGIPEHEAEHYASGLERGHIVVTVQATDAQAPTARRVLDEEGSTRTSGGTGSSGVDLSTPTTPTL